MSRIRVVLADDHTLVRAGLRALLEATPDVEVVAECGNGRECLELLARHRPDVALLDITMPELSGLEVTRRVAEISPRTRVILLSMHGDPTHVRQAMHAGAAGYLLKGATVAELPLALHAVMRGETYLTPKVSRHVVAGYLRPGEVEPDPLAGLTERQREILQLVAEGRSSRQIADSLKISLKTVETHRAHIMERLGIRDLPGLVRFAIRCGLVSSED